MWHLRHNMFSRLFHMWHLRHNMFSRLFHMWHLRHNMFSRLFHMWHLRHNMFSRLFHMWHLRHNMFSRLFHMWHHRYNMSSSVLTDQMSHSYYNFQTPEIVSCQWVDYCYKTIKYTTLDCMPQWVHLSTSFMYIGICFVKHPRAPFNWSGAV